MTHNIFHTEKDEPFFLEELNGANQIFLEKLNKYLQEQVDRCNQYELSNFEFEVNFV
jgi:hypothetical protein